MSCPGLRALSEGQVFPPLHCRPGLDCGSASVLEVDRQVCRPANGMLPEETPLLCRKVLKERQARRQPVPECLGGWIGCGWPGRSTEPEPEKKAGGKDG